MCFSVKLRVYAAENDTRMISGPTLATCWQFALDCKMRTRYNFKKHGMQDLHCSLANKDARQTGRQTLKAKLPTIVTQRMVESRQEIRQWQFNTMVASSASNETKCAKTGTTHSRSRSSHQRRMTQPWQSLTQSRQNAEKSRTTSLKAVQPAMASQRGSSKNIKIKLPSQISGQNAGHATSSTVSRSTRERLPSVPLQQRRQQCNDFQFNSSCWTRQEQSSANRRCSSSNRRPDDCHLERCA